VLAYLAHYTHRVAIANSRLIALDERGVTFRYKDYRRNGQARYRTMTLAADEFIRRFLLHARSLRAAANRAGHRPPMQGSGCEAMIILVLSRQNPFAGTSRSRRRARFVPAPASAGTTSLISRQSGALRHAGRAQAAIISCSQLSPTCAKPSPTNTAARPTPHRRPTARRCPAGSSFGGFRTPAWRERWPG
jgi:Putative transposase